MAYDSKHNRVVLFGGAVLSDTWEWDGYNWTQRFPLQSPSARSAHDMVYDAARERIVLFGEWNNGSHLNDTWEWDGTNWIQRFPETSPSIRFRNGMAYDSARKRVVLFGGLGGDGTRLGDTWEYLTPGLSVTKQASAAFVQVGEQFTYTLALTNTGNISLTTTVTDILPVNITLDENTGGSIIMPPGWIVWSPVTLSPGALWTETVVVTVATGYTGLLTNTVQVTTQEGVSGTDTVVVTAEEGITGLILHSDSPTQIGTPTTLTATVDAGSPITYVWAFGDGDSSEGAAVTHIYPHVGSYTAVVTAANNVSVMSISSPVTITDVSVAGLVVTNDSPTWLGYTTMLSATVVAGSNVKYIWDFGDGEMGSGDVVFHTYPDVGMYTAVVTASNSFNMMTATSIVTITAAPITGLIVTNDSPTLIGHSTTLTATVLTGDDVVYTWDFGDGESGSGDVVTHTYPDVGFYTAIVTATNDTSVVSATSPVTITEGRITGLAAINNGPTMLGRSTTLTATTATGIDITYLWDFGDGEMGSGDVVFHTYPDVGMYTAVVTASNSFNMMTATTTVTITDTPVAGLTATNDSPTPLGGSTILTAAIASGSHVTYTWAFGDGEIGYGEVTLHNYLACGTYTAVVTASNSANSLTATTQVKVVAYVYLPLILKRWPPVPYAPTLYVINNADGDGNYTVSWTEQPTRLADTYTLEEATNAAFTTGLRTVCTTAQQFCTVSGRSAGTYYYRVRGYNTWGYGSWSNVQSIVVRPATPTLTPTPTRTPTGTPTRTPTITPTPTRTPTPMPTPPPQGVYILPNYSHYTSGSTLHIVGEVQNNTSNYAWLVEVPVNLFNSSGQLVDTASTYTIFDLPAGKKSCFHLSVYDPPADWAYFQFEPPDYEPLTNMAWSNLAIYSDHGAHQPDGSYKILGFVRNDEGSRVEGVRIEGALYNASSIIVGCSSTSGSNSKLDPGQASSFELNYSYYYRDYSDVTSYRLQVDGYIP